MDRSQALTTLNFTDPAVPPSAILVVQEQRSGPALKCLVPSFFPVARS